MNNNISKTTALHMAMMLTLIGFSNGPVSAMGFFDAEQNKSLNLKMSDLITATDAEPPVETLKAAEPEIMELPDKLTRVFGRTNNENEKVHYSFTSARGQRVMIYNLPTRAEGPDWNVEYKIRQRLDSGTGQAQLHILGAATQPESSNENLQISWHDCVHWRQLCGGVRVSSLYRQEKNCTLWRLPMV